MDVKLQSAKVLSAPEEKSLDSQIQSLKDVRDKKEVVQGVNWEASDFTAIDKKIAELEKIKQAHGVPELSEAERGRVQKELELLTADLQKDMPTWKQYARLKPGDGAEYMLLVKKIVEWEKNPLRRQKVQRWKTLRRLQDPMDPNIASTIYLFPQ